MKQARVRLSDEAGLHARPADCFVRAARGYRSAVRVRHGDESADGKEIVEVLLLDAGRGTTVTLEVDGPDEDAALPALVGILTRPPTGARLARRTERGRAFVAPLPEARVGSDLEVALARTRADLRAHQAFLARTSEDLAGIFAAQEAMLDALEAQVRARVVGGAEPTAAVRAASAHFAERLDGARATADIGDLRERLLRHLEGRATPLPEGEGPWVYVVLRLEAAVVVAARARGVVAFVTGSLDPTGHAWILARGLGLPVTALPPQRLAAIRAGDWLTVTDETATARDLASVPGRRRVRVRANVGTVEEAVDAFALGADGIGLVRTELLFAAAAAAPSPDAQVAAYAQLLLPFAGAPVTFRLFDAGGDKRVAFLPGGPEPRGIARLRAHPAVLEAQLGALARLSAVAPARILVPYVESPRDLDGLPGDAGAMIESAAGVAEVEAIARRASFLSIGTNDLCASVLGLPRARTTPADVLRPEVRARIAEVVAAARAAGREVTVCGEAAALPEAIDFFLGAGVDALSVAPARWIEVARYVEVK